MNEREKLNAELKAILTDRDSITQKITNYDQVLETLSRRESKLIEIETPDLESEIQQICSEREAILKLKDIAIKERGVISQKAKLKNSELLRLGHDQNVGDYLVEINDFVENLNAYKVEKQAIELRISQLREQYEKVYTMYNAFPDSIRHIKDPKGGGRMVNPEIPKIPVNRDDIFCDRLPDFKLNL